MVFSKSFGYAVRGVLYIAIMQNEKRFVQAEEIGEQLAVPRHFMSKILKSLVKYGIISSVKGPTGGFTITDDTLRTPLMKIFQKTEGPETFTSCVLRMKKCNSANPCPMHTQMDEIRRKLDFVLMNTTIGDLLKEDKVGFIKSIATYAGINSNSELNQTVEN